MQFCLAHIRLVRLRHGSESSTLNAERNTYPRDHALARLAGSGSGYLPALARRDTPLYIIARKELVKLRNNKTTLNALFKFPKKEGQLDTGLLRSLVVIDLKIFNELINACFRLLMC